MSLFDLNGLVALVTGSTRGLGEIAAKAVAKYGADVAVCGRSEIDLEKRRELVRQANQLTSDKVASAFLHHGSNILIYRAEVNYPDESRIPGLVDLDRVTISQ